MANLIATFILLGSIGGITLILYKNKPILESLPEEKNQTEQANLIENLRKKIEEKFPREKTLQRVLSRFRIIVLKVENKIDHLLQRLRKKGKE